MRTCRRVVRVGGAVCLDNVPVGLEWGGEGGEGDLFVMCVMCWCAGGMSW
jgi:hypothetical protein